MLAVIEKTRFTMHYSFYQSSASKMVALRLLELYRRIFLEASNFSGGRMPHLSRACTFQVKFQANAEEMQN